MGDLRTNTRIKIWGGTREDLNMSPRINIGNKQLMWNRENLGDLRTNTRIKSWDGTRKTYTCYL